MIRIPPDIAPGKPIRAAHLIELYQIAASLELQVAPPLTFERRSGALGVSLLSGFWIYITAQSSFNYTWQEKVAQPGGTWADGPRSGTAAADPAIEINMNASVTLSTYQWAWRDPNSGSVLFQGDSC
jgi:hypothetical protein